MAHYNDPDRFSGEWEDAGLHQTATYGLRRLWLHAPADGRDYWICAVAGAMSTSGDTRDEALQSGKNK